jgi:trimeric autotransporter adhesin
LPNPQLSGARDVQITNGGEVRLNGANTYTGVTTIQGKYHTTAQNQAAANTASNVASLIYENTTLSVNNLASGASSSVGGAPDAAGNLIIQGSTLKYTGGAASTNRLFTVGTGGATIDASGAGALTLNNTGALSLDIAEDRPATYFDEGTNFPDGVSGGFTTRARLHIARTDDLIVGMGIVTSMVLSDQLNPANTTTFPAGATITSLNTAVSNPGIIRPASNNVYPTSISFNPAVSQTFPNYQGSGTVSFVGIARTLTLTGSNGGDNTLRSLITDAAATTTGSVNTVNLTKAGTGKWILTGNNTYTGLTRIENGILSITNPYLANTADVRIFTGGIFDLNFSGTDVIDELFFDGAPQAQGTWGAIGNGLATFQSPFFTGTGLLQVGTFNISTLLGDYNQNGVVDSADYIVWRQAQAAGATTLTNRSAGITGAVGLADYDFWRSRFGLTAVTGSSLSDTANVPEPAAGLLAIIAVVGLVGRANRRLRVAVG